MGKREQESRENKRAAPASLASLSSTQWLLRVLDLVGAEPVGSRLRQCPAHADDAPSLSVRAAKDGRCLVHCFGGCRTEDVLGSLRMSWAHLNRSPWATPERHVAEWRLRPAFPPLRRGRGGSGPSGLRLVAVHDYGRHVLERWRHPVTGAKELRWLTVRDGVTIPGLFGVSLSRLPLYLEREARMAVAAGEPVVVCESESSVDAVTAAGIYATTWAGGASAPNLDRLAAVLAGAVVVLVPDNDPAGLDCAARIRAAVEPVARSLHLVLPDPGDDARDLLSRRGPRALLPTTKELSDAR